MKILFYSPVNLKNGLGCERWHCDIANALQNLYGHNIQIVTGNLGINRWTDAYLRKQLKTIQHVKINYPIVFSSLVPTIYIVKLLISLVNQADLVHFITGFIGQDIMFALIKLISGKKIIVGHHAPILFESPIHNMYIKIVSRIIYRYFDYHMVLNVEDKKMLEKWGIRNVHYIPSGVNVEKFINISRSTHSKLNFLLSGRYDTPQKGFDLVLEAISLFNTRYPNNQAIFRFLGSGTLDNPVAKYSSNNSNIVDMGYKQYEDIPQVYKISDVFILSSRSEPFGLVLIEAWASGIPVLATKTAGPLDMLVPEKTGWFFESINIDSMAEGIANIYLKWLNNKKEFVNMSKECRQQGIKYSINGTAKLMQEKIIKYG